MRGGVLFIAAGDAGAARTAAASAAREVIVDVEDLLPPDRRLAGRDALAAALAPRRPDRRGHVRVNGLETDLGFADPMAATALPVACMGEPRGETRERLAIVHRLLTAQERRRGLAPGSLGTVAILESARAFPALDRLGGRRAGRVRLGLGTGGPVIDLSLDRTRDATEPGYSCAALTLASRAQGLAPPIGSVRIAMEDDAGLRASTRRGAAAGMQGKVCLDARQAGITADTLGDAGRDRAARLVAAFDTGRTEGGFVTAPITAPIAALIAAPIAERCRRQLKA